jgi:holo-[acyl-carrier protein] synthase
VIVGSGIDIVDIGRIRLALSRSRERGDRLRQRLYTPKEREDCERRGIMWPHFALRFAAKEAGMKALGTGWRNGVRWRDFETTEEARGLQLRLSGRALELAQDREFRAVWIGASFNRSHAIAHVVLEGGNTDS